MSPFNLFNFSSCKRDISLDIYEMDDKSKRCRDRVRCVRLTRIGTKVEEIGRRAIRISLEEQIIS